MKAPRISLAILVGAIALPFVTSANAATLVSQTFTTSTSTAANNDWFLESATATWTINPGVDVSTASGRFFIGSGAEAVTADAIFIVTGGGQLNISNTSAFTFRLGQDQNAEAGVLRITGGSTVSLTGNQGPFSQESNGVPYTPTNSRSRIEMTGLGSTLMAEGTYDSISGLYNRGTIATEALPISATGSNEILSITYNAGTNVTTFTVIPEPSAALLGFVGMLGLLRRRR